MPSSARGCDPDGEREVPFSSYGLFADRDPLTDLVLERIASMTSAGGDADRPDRACRAHPYVVALGITTEGAKMPLGLWEASTENATVAMALLSIPGRPWARRRAGDPVRYRRRRGASQGGPPGLRRGGARVRCVRHKEAKRLRPPAPRRPRGGAPQAAGGLGSRRPSPRRGSTRGARLRARPHLPRGSGLSSIESMSEVVRRVQRNVKCWRGRDMRLLWTAGRDARGRASVRRITGHRHWTTT